MIHGVFGLPGDGKSYFMMTEVERVLRDTTSVIVTNMRCFPERIAECLHEKYDKSFDVHSRFRFLDSGQSRHFWRYRDGYDLEATGSGKDSRTLYSGLPDGFAGVVYIIDEVHVHFNARNWAQTGADALEYVSQHRKLGDEVFLISQRPKQVDSQMRNLCGEYIQMRNLAHRQLKWMGISWTFPAALHARAYPEEWKSSTSEDVLMWTKTFKVDPKYYGSWYDTAAGVGIKGNKADTGRQKAKGIPFAVLVGVFCLLVGLAFCIPWLFRKAVSLGKGRLDGMVQSSVQTNQVPETVASSRYTPPQQVQPSFAGTNGQPWQLEMDDIKAFSVDRSAFVRIHLKDGRMLTSGDGVVLLGRNGFKYKDRVYPLP